MVTWNAAAQLIRTKIAIVATRLTVFKLQLLQIAVLSWLRKCLVRGHQGGYVDVYDYNHFWQPQRQTT